ncbi:DUF3489 domain-containing protein [Rhizobium sp. FKL33]|uniref:DUF3489 domain-containing protein n=1 Tax=Rhizobium sp. FKL33 TaxID=2562307 RepID=UPI0010C14186|nr:DUF3489 domain-containing protein [Rhizobium sp. FKL33]
MSIITHIRKSVRSHIAGARAAQMTAPEEKLVLSSGAPMASVEADTPPSAPRKAGRKPKRPAKDTAAISGQDPAQEILAPSDARTDAQATQAAHADGASGLKARKTDLVLDLLHRGAGASIADLMAATQWQAHSVRAFLSSVIRKKLQHQVITEKGENGVSRYRLVRETAEGDDGDAAEVDGVALRGDAKAAAAKTATAKAVQDTATIEAV